TIVVPGRVRLQRVLANRTIAVPGRVRLQRVCANRTIAVPGRVLLARLVAHQRAPQPSPRSDRYSAGLSYRLLTRLEAHQRVRRNEPACLVADGNPTDSVDVQAPHRRRLKTDSREQSTVHDQSPAYAFSCATF